MPKPAIILQAWLTINRLAFPSQARAIACSPRAANGLKYSQKIHFMSLYIRFGRSDSPTPCTGTRTESIAMAHTCTAEAMRRVAAARAHYRRSAQRDMRPQHPTVAPVRHPHTHARTHTLHGMQACRTRRPGMRAAAAAAAVMGAMVPPFEDMPGDEPRTSRRKRASGHSRGRPLHHARWNSHSTRGRPWRSSSPRRDPSEAAQHGQRLQPLANQMKCR